MRVERLKVSDAAPRDDDDPGFRSGPWVGYYAYHNHAIRHRMDLHLSFREAEVRGDGLDDVGRFLIQGSYHAESRECGWIKTYPGSHQVYYDGTQRGKLISGRWEITRRVAGIFCIWPKAFGELTREFFLEEEPQEMPAADAAARTVAGMMRR